MKKILTSLLVIGIVGVGAFGASRAFFSDTETSSGNVLAAGAIDLLIDNTSYRTNSAGTALEASEETSWSLRDLTVEKFFNFFDLKPGDEGENTISLHVNNNDAYACAHVAISQDIDNGFTDPEDEMFAGAGDGTSTGDLDEELYFVFWGDDGDNVYENNEVILVQGPVSNIVSTGGTLTIADSSTSPLSASTTKYIGSYFCYGNVTSTAGLTPSTGGPDTRSSGFTCDGTAVTNRSQTDMLIGDLSFYAVQSRNNDGFTCSTVQWPTPVGARVGSSLSQAYEVPTQCDVLVDDDGGTSVFTTIQAAINDSGTNSGETVCVAPGEYNENVNLNKDVTLIAMSNPYESTPANIDGRVDVSANGATLTGFEITPPGSVNDAVRMSASNTAVSSNYIHSVNNSATVKGIHLFGGSLSSPLTNVSINNNLIDNIQSNTNGGYGIMLQGAINGVSAMHNTVSNIGSTSGWASGIEVTPTGGFIYAPKNIAIQFNHVDGVSAGSQPGRSITIDAASSSNVADASEVSLSVNNFVNNQRDVRNLDVVHTLQAPSNYWGADGVNNEGPGSIDTTPTQASAYPTY